MKPFLLLSILPLAELCAAVPAQAQTAARATVLRAEPNVTAQAAGPVAAGAKLDIIKREGFWVHARSGPVRGWLRVTELSFAPAGGAVSLAGLDSGRLGKNNIVSSSASRGLSADELRQSVPDFAAVAALSDMRASPDAVRDFRRQGGLAAVTIAPLRIRPDAAQAPRPATTTSSPSPTDKGPGNEDW